MVVFCLVLRALVDVCTVYFVQCSLHSSCFLDVAVLDARVALVFGDASCAFSHLARCFGRVICLTVANLPVLRRKRSFKLFVLDDMR